ncbi:MAG: cytochrome c3 family protein [bacterium]|nr:MAG: cytochrome c3 family protein [bacterium]
MKNTIKYLTPVILVIALTGIISGTNQDVRQPISFNHKLHTEEVGLACVDCHSNVEKHSRALIPNIETCGDCHDDAEDENREKAKVGSYVSRNEKIPWIQIHVVPDHAYFSHRRHVTLAKIECQTCHGEVSEMERPFIIPFVELEMSWCINCHEKSKVVNDCNSCHR